MELIFIALVALVFAFLKVLIFAPQMFFQHDWIYSEYHNKFCKQPLTARNTLKGRFRHWWRDFTDFYEIPDLP